MDPSTGKGAVWFADEPVCISRRAPYWVKTQKKIARMCAGLGPDAGCWTVADLQAIKRVSRAIRGHSPSAMPFEPDGGLTDMAKDVD